ncbi:hypothetical protein BGP78_10390 [Pseudoalteromonas sp. MSK9-3]|uniref:TnsA endonuclease N-terminal domain-containing protein n=1 Tax=Pseudoalteromonas sp. MSK9-3 TaxID=1897633 RepID=UPI000E6CC03C|nr:TnsA endonuclease N-terminal domain-containing protein [Pseudoalteromonas sp. MSK9-3]RJE76811.1 hypothetical protein BGP78_10390 [Pseudoalteromonas sp. MSK9-3]
MPVRKIQAGYCNLTARVPSKKLDRMADAESSLERDFLFLLEHNDKVLHFEEQPLTIHFGNQYYTPDVLVEFTDSTKTLYEVKYRDELRKNWTKLKPKYKAAINYCHNNNFRFKLITDKEIRTPLLKNIEFLSHFSRTVSPVESAIGKALLDTLIDLGSSSPRELLAACFCCRMKRAEAAPILWRLISNGSVHTNLEHPLSMHSSLTISNDIWETI